MQRKKSTHTLLEKNVHVWHLVALLERASLRIDAITLNNLGVSVRQANPTLVGMYNIGLLERHGKRGTLGGYYYKPTKGFWEIYAGMGFNVAMRHTAHMLKNGGFTSVNYEYQGELGA